MAEGSIQEVNDDGFDALIKEGVTVIDFFAEWCGPCRMLAPVLAEVAGELSGKVKFAKLDIDKNHVTAKAQHVTSVPTMILYKDGEEVNRLVGLRDAAALKDFCPFSINGAFDYFSGHLSDYYRDAHDTSHTNELDWASCWGLLLRVGEEQESLFRLRHQSFLALC